MLTRECTGATRSFYDKETGKIWVPTFEGVVVINPKMNLKNEIIPKIYITEAKVDGKEIDEILNSDKYFRDWPCSHDRSMAIAESRQETCFVSMAQPCDQPKFEFPTARPELLRCIKPNIVC